MPARKRLIICTSCFLLVVGLGIFWAGSELDMLIPAQRFAISLLIGGLLAISLYYLLRQKKIVIQTRQTAGHSELARDEFVANISHELRTPLSGILGVISF